ncbi:LysR family transcriptional regulator [Streptomyces sp. NPDC006422]|uniref:LysR family transcriptional regulator n=1 Tax=unclassified Streptomyces TaxID=2593676 RepID=UPI0033B85767
MLNLVHVQTFRAVLETGSLSAAGKRLGYTTSAVSQQVAALERGLGVRLFERGPRSLRPTHAAERVGLVAASVLNRVDDLEAEVRALARGDRGRLRLGAFPSVGAQLVPRALARLVGRFPEAEFTVHDDARSAAVAEAVHSGRIDLGLVFEYDVVPERWSPELTVHPMLDEEIVVLSGADRHDRLPPRVELASLAEEIWVCNPAGSTGRANLQHWCARAGFAPRIRFETDDFDVIRGIVRENLGIAFAPALALGVDSSILMHRISDHRPRRRVRAVHRADDPNPLLDEALTAIKEGIAAFVEWTTGAFETDTERLPLARPDA